MNPLPVRRLVTDLWRRATTRLPWSLAHLGLSRAASALRCGTRRLRERDLEGALAAYERASARRPRSAAAWMGLARVHRERGFLADSAAAARSALDLRPGWRFAHEHLRRVEDERQVLAGRWRPPAGSGRPIEPNPGTVLQVVTRTLADTVAGYTVRTDAAVRTLTAAGLDVHVLSARGRPVEGDVTLHPGGVQGLTTMTGRLDRLVAVGQEVAERCRPALVHAASDLENGLAGATLAARLAVPFVYEMRGFWELSWVARHGSQLRASDRFAGRQATERRIAEGADRVVVLSETMRAYLSEGGVDPATVAVVPNGIEPDAFADLGDPRLLREAHGLAVDAPVVGYVSTFWEFEGIPTLLDAVERLRRDGSPVRLLLVGDGPVRAELERRVAAADLDGAVIFTRRVAHPRALELLAAMDVFVVPRRDVEVCRVVTPVKPLEALAANRPVIASDLPALRELLPDGVARFVPPDDPERLAEAIGRLLDDPDAAADLAATGRDWVLRERAWPTVARRYLDLYAQLDVVAPSR